MKSSLRVGVVAPSSPVGQVELELGLQRLREEGFDIVAHPQCARRHFTFAGTDTERAEALFELACDRDIDVIWSARGGYGAARLLPMLEQLSAQRGTPKPKLLVGYSDITVLHEFVRNRWNWQTLHAPMPGANLGEIQPDEWRATIALVRGNRVQLAYEKLCLSFFNQRPTQPIQAELIGGNLSLWCSLMGTASQPDARGKLLFFEDLSEPFYRIDRMMTQIVQAGGLDGAAGVILGDFTDCNDETHHVLKPPADDEAWRLLRENRLTAEKIPLRKTYDKSEALDEIFGHVGRQLDLPIAYGLPVGHGPNFSPLPLGAKYELTPDGSLRLVSWKWIGRDPAG